MRYAKQTPTTPPFQFLSGAFTLSNWKIPYFSTTMHLEDAANYLHLAKELPGAETIKWKVQELYQRDIDWPRVEQDILPYLNNRDQPQFFNSITIALLPFDENTYQPLPHFETTHLWNPPPLRDAELRFSKTIEVGPISLGFWDDWENTSDLGFQGGELCWNKEQLYGVAIDGQHRLAAIKSLVNNIAPSTKEFQQTRIPIVLLIFAPQLGFSSPSLKDHVELLRIIFIDLNKHSKPVTRARQILLDDRDPHAVCVRALVTNQLTDNYGQLTSTPPKLPLSIVDWHSEQARFDTGPYVTTILGLDWIISQILESRPLNDYTEYGKIKTQLENITKSLHVNLDEAIDRVDELAKLEISPFSYTDGELDTIAMAFSKIWSKPICELLTKFKPYEDLMHLREDHNSLSLEFQQWYELREKAESDGLSGQAKRDYKLFVDRLEGRNQHPITEVSLKSQLWDMVELKWDNLAFNVAFQKSLIEAFVEYSKIGSRDQEELRYLDNVQDDFDIDFDGPEQASEDGYYDLNRNSPNTMPTTRSLDEELSFREAMEVRVDQFLQAMNLLVMAWPEILRINASFQFVREDGADLDANFWLGTLLKPDGGIDFTQAASRRAKDLLFVAAAMKLYDNETEPGSGSEFEAFWDRCFADDAPLLCKRVRRAIVRYTTERRQTSAAYRILKAREILYTEDRALFEARIRFAELWRVLDL